MQRIGKQIALTVSFEQQERIAKIAKKHNLKKAHVYRNMIDFGLDVYDGFEKTGIVKFVDFGDRAKEIVKLWLNRKQGKLFS